MTIHKTEDHVFRAIQEGADGYVLKDSSATELLLAVRRVVAGKRYLCSAVATQFVNAFLQGNTVANPVSKVDRLSPREREVLKLVARGIPAAKSATICASARRRWRSIAGT